MANLVELQADLAKYRAARDKILLGGQAYSGPGISKQSASLEAIEKTIEKLERKIAMLSGDSAGFVTITPKMTSQRS